MDIRALMSKLQSIESMTKVMEAGEDPAAVIQKYTDMGKKPTADMPAFIDPKDGKVKYVDKGNARMGGEPEIKVMPSDWIKRYAPDLADALAAQGGNKQGYGAQQKAGIGAGIFGSDWKGIGSFDQGTKVNTAQAGADSRSNKFIADKLKQLTDLVGKLKTPSAGNTDPTTGKIDYSLGGGGAKLKLSAMEDVQFSSSIARSLLESFDLDEADAPTFAQDVAARKAAMQPGGATEKQPGLPASQDGSVARIAGQAATDSVAAPAGGPKDDIVKELQAVMAELADTGDNPEVAKALADAQAAIDAYKKANTKPTGSAALDPARNPDPATNIPGGQSAGGDGVDPTKGDRAKKIARMKELLAKAGAK